MPEPQQLLTIAQVADRLQLSRRTVYRLVRRGLLRVVHVTPRRVRFRPADLDAYVAAREARKRGG
jgi:excisionase family DNA binding protein